MPANELRLDDGFSTFITLANIPTIKLFEKEVTPSQITAGGAIDTTTMRNTEWRTMAPKKLKTFGTMTATVAYATSAIPALFAQIGKVQLVTVTWPDNSTVSFWGYLEEFTPGTNTDGEQPTASITVQPTLRHPDTGLEVSPDYNPADESGES